MATASSRGTATGTVRASELHSASGIPLRPAHRLACLPIFVGAVRETTRALRRRVLGRLLRRRPISLICLAAVLSLGDAASAAHAPAGSPEVLGGLPNSATPAVTAGAPRRKPPRRKPSKKRKPYYVEHFDGSFTQAFWHLGGSAKPLAWVDGSTGKAMRLTNYANAPATSDYGQLAYLVALAQYAHAGWLPGTDPLTGNGFHEEVWYRLKVRFPGARLFRPNPGAISIFQPHIDARTETLAGSIGSEAYSNKLQVNADGPSTGMPKTTPGRKPRLMLRVYGGVLRPNDPYGRSNVRTFQMHSRLRLDHWYDIVIHYVLGETRRSGYVQWWVDRRKIADAHVPTQYLRPDGTLSFGENIECINYRQLASWDSSVDFDELRVGPTRSSIGFTR